MWSFLITVNSEIEADIIIGLLEDARIPTQKRDPGGLKASYGIVNGIEIWVPSESKEHAQELIKTFSQGSGDSSFLAEEAGDEFNVLDENSSKLSGGLFFKPVVICFILILGVLFYGLLKE